MLAFGQHNRSLLTADVDMRVRYWDLASGRPLGQPLVPGSRVKAIHLSSEGRALATVTELGLVHVWGTPRGEQYGLRFATNRSQSEPTNCYRVAFSTDGQTMVSTSIGSQPRLWKVSSRQPLGPPLPHHSALHAVFRPDGQAVFTAGHPATRVWDVPNGRPLGNPLPATTEAAGITLSLDGKRILLADGTDGRTLQILDVASGERAGPSIRAPDFIMSSALTPDGKTILTGCYDGTMRFWDAVSGKEQGQPLRHQGPVDALALSADGTRIFSSGRGNNAQLWDFATRQPVGPPLLQQASIRSVGISPDGRLLATGNMDGTARFWHAATGKPLGPPLHHPRDEPVSEGSRVYAVEFSPDGRTLLTGSLDDPPRLFDVPTALAGRTEQIRLWTEVITGMSLNEEGVVQVLEVADWGRRRQQLQENGGPPPLPEDDPLLRHREEAASAERAKQPWAVVWHLDRLIPAVPPEGALHSRRGRARLALGRWQKAAEDFSAALELRVDEPDLHYLRGHAYARLGRYQDALIDYEAATLPPAQEGATWLSRSFAYACLDRSEKATESYARAERLSQTILVPTTRWWSQRWEGVPRQESQEVWREALRDFENLREKGRAPAWAQRGQGLALGALADWKQAAEQFRRAAEQQPDDPHAWVGLGRARAEQGQWDQAAEAWSKALELDSENGAVQYARGLCFTIRDPERAIADWTKALERRADGWAVWGERGAAYERRARLKEAVADFSQAIDRHGTDWWLRYHRGDCLAGLQRWEQAALDFRKTVELRPSEQPAWYRLALVQLAQGDTAGYRAACREVLRVELRPGRPLPPTLLWMCLFGDAGVDRERLYQAAGLGQEAKAATLQTECHAAVALLRAGAAAEAIQRLNQVLAAADKKTILYDNLPPGATAYEWLFLALAQGQLGQVDAARESLARADRWLENLTADKPSSANAGGRLQWNQVLELRLLHEQAEALVKSKVPSPPNGDVPSAKAAGTTVGHRS
jgi:tetratricopeptide (TPR) repeat protein/WD40 repeat protein